MPSLYSLALTLTLALPATLASAAPGTSDPTTAELHAIKDEAKQIGDSTNVESCTKIRDLRRRVRRVESSGLLVHNLKDDIGWLLGEKRRKVCPHVERDSDDSEGSEGNEGNDDGGKRPVPPDPWQRFERAKGHIAELRDNCRDPESKREADCLLLPLYETTMVEIGLHAIIRRSSRVRVEALMTEIKETSIGEPDPHRCLDPISRAVENGILDPKMITRTVWESALLDDQEGLWAMVLVARRMKEIHPELAEIAALQEINGPAAQRVREIMRAADDLVAMEVYREAGIVNGQWPALFRRNTIHFVVVEGAEDDEGDGSTCDPLDDVAREMGTWLNLGWPDGVRRSAVVLPDEDVERAHRVARDMLTAGCGLPMCRGKGDLVAKVLCSCPHGGLITVRRRSDPRSGPGRVEVQWTTAYQDGEIDGGSTSTSSIPWSCSSDDQLHREQEAGVLARTIAGKVASMKKFPSIPVLESTQEPLGRHPAEPDPIVFGKPSRALLSAGLPWLQVDRRDRVGWVLTGTDSLFIIGAAAAGGTALVLEDLALRSREAWPGADDGPIVVRARASGAVAVTLLGTVLVERLVAFGRYRRCVNRSPARACSGRHWQGARRVQEEVSP